MRPGNQLQKSSLLPMAAVALSAGGAKGDYNEWNLAADSATLQANGYNYFANYALGLDPKKTDDKPIVDVTTDANGNYVFTVKHRNEQGELVAITPADNVSTTVTLKYGTGAASLSGSATGAAISPADMFSQAGLNGSNVIYYKAEVTISAK